MILRTADPTRMLARLCNWAVERDLELQGLGSRALAGRRLSAADGGRAECRHLGRPLGAASAGAPAATGASRLSTPRAHTITDRLLGDTRHSDHGAPSGQPALPLAPTPSRGGIAYAQFFTPAMVAFAVVNACYMSVISSTALARDEGILKRLRGTPLPPWIYMTGRLGSAGLVALVSAIVVVAVGASVYGFEVVWSAEPCAYWSRSLQGCSASAHSVSPSPCSFRPPTRPYRSPGERSCLCVSSPTSSCPSKTRPSGCGRQHRSSPCGLRRRTREFNPVIGSPSLNWHHLEIIIAWGVAAAAFALIAFRWEPGRPDRRRGMAQAIGAFATRRPGGTLQPHPTVDAARLSRRDGQLPRPRHTPSVPHRRRRARLWPGAPTTRQSPRMTMWPQKTLADTAPAVQTTPPRPADVRLRAGRLPSRRASGALDVAAAPRRRPASITRSIPSS